MAIRRSGEGRRVCNAGRERERRGEEGLVSEAAVGFSTVCSGGGGGDDGKRKRPLTEKSTKVSTKDDKRFGTSLQNDEAEASSIYSREYFGI